MAMRLWVIFLLFLTLANSGFTQGFSSSAKRTNNKIKVDGLLNETDWENAIPISNFKTYSPTFNQTASEKTTVKVLYDDKALYISAELFDKSPDKILTEYTKRDEDNGNTDMFWLSLNPNNDGLNMYEFKVTASNVQTDIRYSNGDADYNWDAVWESGVSIHDKGWTVEIKIPYSALRFPNLESQSWSINFWRKIRRLREISSWKPVDQKQGNVVEQMGSITNINNINPPLRLSLYPYLSSNITHQSQSNSLAYDFSGGLDLKLGLSKSHTLDMTLIPDFSQVKSDEQVLNLTPFETYYDENRPFFTEGTELFQKGDLFYSRRIGKIPSKYFEVRNLANEGYEIKKNPRYSKLINAVKITGRGENNLAIGFLNAVTANTYAEVVNPSGETEFIKTEPWANYNILVLDQSFKNNSFLNFTNTRLDRPDSKYHSNVLGSSWKFMEKSNRFGIQGNLAWSNIQDSISNNDNEKDGFKLWTALGKFNGAWQYDYSISMKSDAYQQNDLGYQQQNNSISHAVSGTFNKFEPFWKLNRFRHRTELGYQSLYSEMKFKEAWMWMNTYAVTKNYISIWNNMVLESPEVHDYYESRENGKVYIRKGVHHDDIYFSTDYRKTLALDFRIGCRTNFEKNNAVYGMISPRVRLNDKITLRYKLDYDIDRNDLGHTITYHNETGSDIVFGERDVETYVQSISGSWVFNNKMYLSLDLRHYWRKVDYKDYFLLQDNGYLSDESYLVDIDTDINFNTFNIDLTYSWNFAPGSFLSLVWKNELYASERIPESARFPSMGDNFKSLWEEGQTNTLSLKVLYYIDWQYFLKS